MRETQTYYKVTVTPEGNWMAYFNAPYDYPRLIGQGEAPDQVRGEKAARFAIEDDKAQRAKERIFTTLVREFTVKA